ncbi:hypothetical protein, partial [Tenacibaculum discolor]|uniref:hypothetical protein n=1 Tax=Tenacibaculum discolor TaxID=361581 RepID=UPI001F451519
QRDSLASANAHCLSRYRGRWQLCSRKGCQQFRVGQAEPGKGETGAISLCRNVGTVKEKITRRVMIRIIG